MTPAHLIMASRTVTRTFVDGTKQTFRRKKQGRRARDLVKWSGYLSKSSLEFIEEHVKPLRPYYDVSTVIRDALDNYVMTKLVKH